MEVAVRPASKRISQDDSLKQSLQTESPNLRGKHGSKNNFDEPAAPENNDTIIEKIDGMYSLC